MLTLGIDFSTSNSAAAVIDDSGTLRVIPLSASRFEMPTAVFLMQKPIMFCMVKTPCRRI